jgi:hypothetical protein
MFVDRFRSTIWSNLALTENLLFDPAIEEFAVHFDTRDRFYKTLISAKNFLDKF